MVHTPDRELTIGEEIHAFQRHRFFHVCTKGKPHKYGIKIFHLCEAKSGYVHNIKIHAGIYPTHTGYQQHRILCC